MCSRIRIYTVESEFSNLADSRLIVVGQGGAGRVAGRGGLRGVGRGQNTLPSVSQPFDKKIQSLTLPVSV